MLVCLNFLLNVLYTFECTFRQKLIRVVKPYCRVLLLTGSSPPPVSTVEVELEELVKKLQKGRLEGEYIFRQKIIVVECF